MAATLAARVGDVVLVSAYADGDAEGVRLPAELQVLPWMEGATLRPVEIVVEATIGTDAEGSQPLDGLASSSLLHALSNPCVPVGPRGSPGHPVYAGSIGVDRKLRICLSPLPAPLPPAATAITFAISSASDDADGTTACTSSVLDNQRASLLRRSQLLREIATKMLSGLIVAKHSRICVPWFHEPVTLIVEDLAPSFTLHKLALVDASQLPEIRFSLQGAAGHRRHDGVANSGEEGIPMHSTAHAFPLVANTLAVEIVF